MTTEHSSKDEGSCGQRIANMICVLPKGHSGLHDDLDDAASNRMRLIDAEQELVAKNNRIAALERENAELKALVTNRESTIEFLQESAAERERDIERAAHEPNKLHQALYAAVNDMMIVIGMHGSIDRRDDRVTHVMDALHAIDGGVYKPLETDGVPLDKREHQSKNTGGN